VLIPWCLSLECLIVLWPLVYGRILESYRTGHGRLTVRGKASIEQLDRKSTRSAVIISEVSYHVDLYVKV
jgi:hypothetical protein